MQALSEESGVVMNTLDNREHFVQVISLGKWDHVLKALSNLSIPSEKLFGLYELIIVEFLCSGDLDVARALLRQSNVMQNLKDVLPSKYLKLETLLSQASIQGSITFGVYYKDISLDDQRRLIANELLLEIPVVPNGRLLTLLGEAIKYQVKEDKLPPNCTYDIFRGVIPAGSVQNEIVDQPISECFLTRKFPAGSHVEAAAFSSKGKYFAVGLADGFIEILNTVTGERRLDLFYQREMVSMMVMEHPITCLAFGPKESMFAVGTLSGEVAIWKVDTGGVVQRIRETHKNGASCVRLSKDHNRVLTAGYDGLVRLWNVRSGKLIKEFRRHTSFVNDCHFFRDDTMMLSCGSEGLFCIWDISHGQLIREMNPFSGDQLSCESIKQIVPISDDQVMLCSKSGILMHIDPIGSAVADVIQLSGNENGIATGCLSPRGKYLYLLHETGGTITRYELATRLTVRITGSPTELIGGTIHPHLSQLMTFDIDGNLKFWKPNK